VQFAGPNPDDYIESVCLRKPVMSVNIIDFERYRVVFTKAAVLGPTRIGLEVPNDSLQATLAREDQPGSSSRDRRYRSFQNRGNTAAAGSSAAMCANV
jgi:hypothetical protein